ncbi:beta-N-acetylhexosaminidase [Deferrisoma camini]|uniref:beta-N-acetylhexosaminidase n=1 Tax=Deferrisoma camini TaxID=1035120 RepID=UPI00046D49E6|nr:beta-N-acetylhexosaminidase [Deferrisoma camini]
MIERPGRLLVVGFPGTTPPPELFSFARRWGLAGVILFSRNVPEDTDVARLVAAVRQGLAEADPGSPALVLVDQEGGRVERVRHGVPRLPAARDLAASPLAELTAGVEAQARALAAFGIDVNLAPVCDLPAEGESGVIGDRAFGSDPRAVAACVRAHVRACLRGGVAPCAKHFPGHGRARADSHRRLPTVRAGWDDLWGRDLVPFRAAVGDGAPLVMAGHLRFPAVDLRPATLSPVWIEEVLRGRMGFAGAVISDDMEMGALDGLGPPPDVAVRAVAAGCDLLIYGRTLRPDLALEPVAEALGRRLGPERAAQAERRLGRLGRGGAP